MSCGLRVLVFSTNTYLFELACRPGLHFDTTVRPSAIVSKYAREIAETCLGSAS